MADEANREDWLAGHCPHVWLLLDNRARRRLPPGLLEYLSLPSEARLDKLVPKDVPPLPWLLDLAHERRQHVEQHVREGRKHVREADEYIQKLIEVCGERTVADAYRRDLSGVNTEDQVAELFCEVAFCAVISELSSTPPRLRPPSNRPGWNTHCDVRLQIANIPVFAEVKRFPDPWLRGPGARIGKEEWQPIDLYRKLQENKVSVPEQFPVGTVNLVFVFHSSFNKQETLEQALLGWREDHLRPARPEVGHHKGAGLFAHEAWRNISGCCLSRLTGSKLQLLNIWENPRANVPLPSLVHNAPSKLEV